MADRGSWFLKSVPSLAGPALTLGLALLAACGDGPTPPSAPIPENLFLVTISNARWQCASGSSATDPGVFALVMVPQLIGGSSYDIYHLDATPVSANFSDDHLTLSRTFSDSIAVVDFSVDWTFSNDRLSFTGATTFDVHRSDGAACTFTFATEGKLGATGMVHNPPAPPTGNVTTSASQHEFRDPCLLDNLGVGCWGQFAYVRPNYPICAYDGIYIQPPAFVRARNVDGTFESDHVYWRYRIYREASLEAAQLRWLTASLGTYDATQPIGESRWYFSYFTEISSGGNFENYAIGGRANWLDYSLDPTFVRVYGQSPYRPPEHGYYIVFYDVYWGQHFFSGVPGPLSFGWMQIPSPLLSPVGGGGAVCQF